MHKGYQVMNIHVYTKYIKKNWQKKINTATTNSFMQKLYSIEEKPDAKTRFAGNGKALRQRSILK